MPWTSTSPCIPSCSAPPSLGDYGLTAPLYAHLVRDLWPVKNLIEPRHHLHAWIKRTNQPLKNRERAKVGATLPRASDTRPTRGRAAALAVAGERETPLAAILH